MLKKILIFNGSPRKNGNTATTAQWVQEGAFSKGGLVETIQVSAIKYAYNGCSGCRRCKVSEEYKCFIDDEVSRIIYKMTDYDVIVFAAPVYFGGFPGPLKSLLDRMYSQVKIKDGVHTANPLFKNVTIALIATSGSDYDNGLSDLAEYMKVFVSEFSNKLHQFIVPCCKPGPDNLKLNNEIREKAIAFGEELMN